MNRINNFKKNFWLFYNTTQIPVSLAGGVFVANSCYNIVKEKQYPNPRDQKYFKYIIIPFGFLGGVYGFCLWPISVPIFGVCEIYKKYLEIESK